MPHNALQKTENSTFVVLTTVYFVDLPDLCFRSYLSNRGRIPHYCKRSNKKILFNAFVCLKDFLLSNHMSMKKIRKRNLRGSNEQKVYISLHEFKVVDGRLVAQKSHHITCKSWKKRSAKRRSIETNDDKLLRRPAPSHRRHHLTKKSQKKLSG